MTVCPNAGLFKKKKLKVITHSLNQQSSNQITLLAFSKAFGLLPRCVKVMHFTSNEFRDFETLLNCRRHVKENTLFYFSFFGSPLRAKLCSLKIETNSRTKLSYFNSPHEGGARHESINAFS